MIFILKKSYNLKQLNVHSPGSYFVQTVPTFQTAECCFSNHQDQQGQENAS